MKIKVLSSAIEDLYKGRLFYEKQGEGLGEYFFDSLFSEIDSLVLYGGVHIKVFTIACCPRDFLTPSIISLKGNHELLCIESLIYVVTPRRSNSH